VESLHESDDVNLHAHHRVSLYCLIDEAVDVSDRGDMAVYWSTYNQESVDKGVSMTQKVNFLAGFRRQGDGSWKIGWSVVCATEKPHRK